MEEFLKIKSKVLKIENPIAMFSSVLSSNDQTQRAEKWQTLNTLMTINNHRRIDRLEDQLSEEQARVRFLEDFSGQLDGKVGTLEKSMHKVKTEISRQKRSLVTVLTIVKIISNHQRGMKDEPSALMLKLKSLIGSAVKNGLIFGLVQLLIRLTWLDGLVDGLIGLMKLGNFMSRRSLERSRFLMKLSLSLALFALLRNKILEFLKKLRQALTFFN